MRDGGGAGICTVIKKAETAVIHLLSVFRTLILID
jgi:hypothetical protein